MNQMAVQNLPDAWNPVPLDEQEQKLLDVADAALGKARQLGADSAEVSLGHGSGFTVNVRNGEVETIEYNRDKNLGVTVFFGCRSGGASTTDFSGEAVSSCVEAASRIARYTEEDPYSGLAEESMLARDLPDLDLYHPWDIEMQDAIEIARRCEDAVLSADNRINNTEGGSLSTYGGANLYANSLGFHGLSRASQHGISCCAIGGSGDAMQRDYSHDSQRDPGNLMSPESVGQDAARRILRRLGASRPDTMTCPVVFDVRVASSLLSSLVSAISGGSLYRKSSFLTDSLNTRLFQPFIRIHEQPHLKGAAGSAGYDNEGVATRDREIVQEGTLRSYLLGSYSARKLGMQTTGNAGGVHNLSVDPTMSGGLEELLVKMGDGLLVTELFGFGVNLVSGDYSQGAFGFLVKNGQIAAPVQELTIAGNLREMFMAIEAVAADVDMRRNIRTGSILISQMTVAGA